jgi:hypothetical protein
MWEDRAKKTRINSTVSTTVLSLLELTELAHLVTDSPRMLKHNAPAVCVEFIVNKAAAGAESSHSPPVVIPYSRPMIKVQTLLKTPVSGNNSKPVTEKRRNSHTNITTDWTSGIR